MKQELPACPVEITMGLIGDKWKVLIIRDLLTGTKRFGELKKSLSGITQKVLTNNLIFFDWYWIKFKTDYRFDGRLGKWI